MSRVAIRPRDVLKEAASLRVAIQPGSEPGRVKLIGPAEAVQKLRPLVQQADRAELLAALREQQSANDEAAPTPARTCRECAKLSPAGTCTDPVGAGLRPHFGIVWPEPACAVTCLAFVERQRPASAPAVPRRSSEWG